MDTNERSVDSRTPCLGLLFEFGSGTDFDCDGCRSGIYMKTQHLQAGFARAGDTLPPANQEA